MIAEFAYSLNREKKNEIAFIYDQESCHTVSMYTNTLMLDYYRTSDLPRIGASVDYYFHDDMGREDMPDYKFYVMMNLFDISDKEREIIIQKDKEKPCRGALALRSGLHQSGSGSGDGK